MRNPSIHITVTQLAGILEQLQLVDPKQMGSYEVAIEIASLAAPKSISSRSVVVTNDRIEKKAKKMLASSRTDANLFAQLLQANRRKLRHRGIRQIKPNTRDWGMIKELAGMALEFTNEFKLERREGFNAFINTALGKMRKFQLNKIANMYEGICEEYEGKLAMLSDPNRDFTTSLYKTYINMIIQKTGIEATDYSEPSQYKFFIEASVLALKYGISPSIYIKAQFAALEWTDGYPNPIQLTGDKAIKNLNKYLYENNINTKKERTAMVDFSKILKAK